MSDKSDNPVFVYAALYADRADADADYDTLLDCTPPSWWAPMTSRWSTRATTTRST